MHGGLVLTFILMALGASTQAHSKPLKCRETLSQIAQKISRTASDLYPVRDNGRGQWIPPASKLFIAWRSRTPLHIPDSAFYTEHLTPHHVHKVVLDSQRNQSALSYTTFEKYLESSLKNLRDKIVIMSRRAITLSDENGELRMFLLSPSETGHNQLAERLLDNHPDWRFVSSENLEIEITLNSQGEITKANLLPMTYHSPYLSNRVLGTMDSNERATLGRLQILQKCLQNQVAIPLAPRVAWVTEQSRTPTTPINPSEISRQLHRLK